MKYRKIRDIEVSAMGFGVMGMSHGYGNDLPDRSEMIKLIRSSLKNLVVHSSTQQKVMAHSIMKYFWGKP